MKATTVVLRLTQHFCKRMIGGLDLYVAMRIRSREIEEAESTRSDDE